jgi:2-dehydro-3-deoxyphosphogluconate aldolase / (4S)-4-hydroxy-2-oxoglutarate aldolase
MWTKFERLRVIHETGMLVIVRADGSDETMKIAEAAIAGGVKALEVPYAVPDVLAIVKELKKRHTGEDIVIGVGTVLDAEHAAAALLAGADMLVSSCCNLDMIKMGNRYQAVTIAGAMSPTEISEAMAAGSDLVKLFPADYYDAKYIKTVRAPLSTAPIVPFGGVTADNVGEWFRAGAAAVGIGSYITKAHKADGDYKKVTAAAQKMLQIIKDCR